MAQWGLYCLANDAVLDWTLAFLESLRTYSPGVELVVIPFDHRVDRLAALAPVYDFAMLDNPDLLGSLDSIGRALHPGSTIGEKMFRKFAAFHGAHDHFLFLDSDIVVLTALDRLMDRLLASQADFIYFDTSPDWVYADAAFRERMQREFGSKQFASGALASRKGFISLEDLSALPTEADHLRRVFPAGVFDQPYWNYLVDRKKARVAAVYEIIPELAPGQWAAGPLDRPRDLRANTVVTRKGKVLPFIHWAGYRCNHKIPNLDLFVHFRVRAERSWIGALRCRYRFRSAAWRGTQVRWSARRVWRELVGFGRAPLRPDVLRRMMAAMSRRRVQPAVPPRDGPGALS